MENKAIIIIDMLNDFVTGKLEAKRAKHIIPNLKRLVEAARKNKVPVIYSNDAHYPQDVEVTRKWGKHAIKGTKGAEVIPELKPAEKDYVVEKRTYSSFYETGLDPLVEKLIQRRRRENGYPRRLAHEHVRQAHGCRRLLQRIQNNNRRGRRGSFHAGRPRARSQVSGVRLQREDNDVDEIIKGFS